MPWTMPDANSLQMSPPSVAEGETLNASAGITLPSISAPAVTVNVLRSAAIDGFAVGSKWVFPRDGVAGKV